MKIEPKFDVNKATLDHIWLGTDDGNDVFIVRVTDPVNRTERFVWPGDSLDRKVRNLCDQPETVKKLLLWIRRSLLESENMVISVNPELASEDTGMAKCDVQDAMLCLSKMQETACGEGDGDWMTWHDEENWDADLYPQVLTEFLWPAPRKAEFTDVDEEAIERFRNDLVEFIVSYTLGDVNFAYDEDDVRWLVDRAEFVGELADVICKFCANRGVDLHYPEHVTEPFTGDEIVRQCAEPDSYTERDKWLRMLKEHYETKGD